MTISPKIWEFPSFPISKQLFHVPGGVTEGGFTSGGAQIVTPEPAGNGVLEIHPALQVNEWEYPISSWLMSKGNGAVLRVRLAPTPQVSWSRRRNAATVTWDDSLLWSNEQPWEGDFTAIFVAAALEGSTAAVIDLTGVGQVLQMGHVIGSGNSCHLIDEIAYEGDIASVTLNPPHRRTVDVNDPCYLRPWFTGRISNPNDIRATYDAEQNGHIQPGQITLVEAIVP